MESYNPKIYWEKRGGQFKEIKHLDELENLYSFVAPAYDTNKNIKILEVGSGNGRVYLYLNDKKIANKNNFTMCDFSNSFRKVCYKNTKIYPDSWDGKKLPYKDNEFDLVISFSVLLHVLPDDIENFFEEHLRVSKKYCFIATWYENLDRIQSKDYCFEHDYYSLFSKNKLKILNDVNCDLVDGKYRRKNWLICKG